MQGAECATVTGPGPRESWVKPNAARTSLHWPWLCNANLPHAHVDLLFLTVDRRDHTAARRSCVGPPFPKRPPFPSLVPCPGHIRLSSPLFNVIPEQTEHDRGLGRHTVKWERGFLCDLNPSIDKSGYRNSEILLVLEKLELVATKLREYPDALLFAHLHSHGRAWSRTQRSIFFH